jgi:hypothetical protein
MLRNHQPVRQAENGLPPITVTHVKYPFLTEGGRVCRTRASSSAHANSFSARSVYAIPPRRDILLEDSSDEEQARAALRASAAAAAAVPQQKPLFGKSIGSANIHLEAYEKRRQRLQYLEWTMKHDALASKRKDSATRNARASLTAEQLAQHMLPGFAGASRDFCDGENDVTSRALARLDAEERDAANNPGALGPAAKKDPSFSSAAALDWKGGRDLETLRRTAPKFATLYHFAANPREHTVQEQKRMCEATQEARATESLRARNPMSPQYVMERHLFRMDPVRRLWQDTSSQTELYRALHRARLESQAYLKRRRFLVNLIPDLRFFSELLELHYSTQPGARQCERCSRWHQCCLASALDASSSKSRRFHCSGNLFALDDVGAQCKLSKSKLYPDESPFDGRDDSQQAASREFLRAFAANPDLILRRWKTHVATQSTPEGGSVSLPAAAFPSFMAETQSTVADLWSSNHVSTQRVAKLEVADIMSDLLELVPGHLPTEQEVEEEDVQMEEESRVPPVLVKKGKRKATAKKKRKVVASSQRANPTPMIPRWAMLLRLHEDSSSDFEDSVNQLWTKSKTATTAPLPAKAPPPPSKRKRGRNQEPQEDEEPADEQPAKLSRTSRSGRVVKAPSKETYTSATAEWRVLREEPPTVVVAAVSSALTAASSFSSFSPSSSSTSPPAVVPAAEPELSGIRAQFQSTLRRARVAMAEQLCRALQRLAAAGIPVELVQVQSSASPLERIVVGKQLAHPTYWYEACLLALRKTACFHHFDLRPVPEKVASNRTVATAAESGSSASTKGKDEVELKCDDFGFLIPREDRETQSLETHLRAAIDEIHGRLVIHFGASVPKLECFLPQIKSAPLKAFPLARRLRFSEIHKDTTTFNATDWRWNMQHLIRTTTSHHALLKELRAEPLNLSAETALPHAELWYMDSPEACADGIELHNYNKYQKACEFLRVVHPGDHFASEPKWFSRLETAKEYMRPRFAHKAAANKSTPAQVNDAGGEPVEGDDDVHVKLETSTTRKRGTAGKKSDMPLTDKHNNEDKKKSAWLSWVDVETGETMLNMARMGGFVNDAHMRSVGAHRDWCAMQCRDECTRACGEHAFRQHEIPCEHAQRRRVQHALMTMRAKLGGGGAVAEATVYPSTCGGGGTKSAEVERLLHTIVGWVCRVLAYNIFGCYKQNLRCGGSTFKDFFVGMQSKLFAGGNTLARDEPPDAVFQAIANHDLDAFWRMLHRVHEVELRILPKYLSLENGDGKAPTPIIGTPAVRKFWESTPSFAQTRVFTDDGGLPNSSSIFAASHPTMVAVTGARKRKRASKNDAGTTDVAAGTSAAPFNEHTTLTEIREAEQRAEDEATLLSLRHHQLQRRQNKNYRKAAPVGSKNAQFETGIWYVQTVQQCQAQRLQDPAGWVSHLVLGPSAERRGFHPWMPTSSQHVRIDHLTPKLGRFAWLASERLRELPIDREIYDARQHGDAAATIFEFTEGDNLMAVEQLAPLRMHLNLLKWLSRWLVAHEVTVARADGLPADAPDSSRWVSLLDPTQPVHEWSLPRRERR